MRATDGYLNNPGDSVQLYDASQALIDSVPWTSSAGSNLALARQPDGGAWTTGWVPPTRGAANVAAQSCAVLGWSVLTAAGNAQGVCSGRPSSLVTSDDTCDATTQTWSHATLTCAAIGARLCTGDELMTGLLHGGCPVSASGDTVYWTSTAGCPAAANFKSVQLEAAPMSYCNNPALARRVVCCANNECYLNSQSAPSAPAHGALVQPSPPYTSFRFNIIERRNDPNTNAFGELTFYDSASMQLAGGSCTNPGGTNSDTHYKACDGDLTTSWFSGNAATSAGVIVTFAAAQTVGLYDWATVDASATGRDPVKWKLQASNDAVTVATTLTDVAAMTWDVLDDTYATTAFAGTSRGSVVARNKFVGPFSLPPAPPPCAAGDTLSDGAVCSITCDAGYALAGSEAACASGILSPGSATCELICTNLATLSAPSHGSLGSCVGVTLLNPGGSCALACAASFTLSGTQPSCTQGAGATSSCSSDADCDYAGCNSGLSGETSLRYGCSVDSLCFFDVRDIACDGLAVL